MTEPNDIADDEAAQPARITSRRFLEALREADVIRRYEYPRRVVIDAHIDQALRIYVERIGDERALSMAPLLTDLGVEPAAHGETLAAVEANPLDELALSESARKDLDETRRLLYMGTVVSRTKKYNLAGTLINAIKHHQGSDTPVDELTEWVVNLVEGRANTWAYEEIERITAQLGES